MKEFINKNKYIILTITVLCGIMFYFIGLKSGFHEDEIFSYGSSNYKYDNVYRWYGYAEADNDVLYNQILQGNIGDKISNVSKYLKDKDSFEKNEVLSKEVPTFKTREEAKEYLVINNGDMFNYFSVYYNQARDVHPPLFYFLVHFISTIFYGQFTKYIIFTLNLIFFIGSLLIIKRIMSELKQDKLTIPVMILYGASIGCISTVMFQRMYMMLTFFGISYLYLTLKFINDNYNIKSKKWWIITILLGFLTQYYFCVYIVLIFAIVAVYLIIKKEYKKLLNYFIVHLIPAIIGIVLYPFAIEDIFFSYRGIGSIDEHNKTIIDNLVYYFGQIYKLFGLNNLLLILCVLLTCTIIYKIVKKDFKYNKDCTMKLIVLIIPVLLYILVMCKISPFLGELYTSRYIMILFPVIAIIIIYGLSLIYTKNMFVIALCLSIVLSINGIICNKPVYLYEDNKKVIDLANNNSDKYLVYVFDNYFTHLSSMPEFTIYKEHLILNNNIHDFSILNNDKLNNSNEFILCVKNWINQDEVLNKVFDNTDYKNYEVLLNLNSDVEATYYKISK